MSIYDDLCDFDPVDNIIDTESRQRIVEKTLALMAPFSHRFGDWERSFVSSLSRQAIDGRALSDKQVFHVLKIAQSVARAGMQDGNTGDLFDIILAIAGNLGHDKVYGFEKAQKRNRR